MNKPPRWLAAALLVPLGLLVLWPSPGARPQPPDQTPSIQAGEDTIRTLEKLRLRALVSGDTLTAGRLLAPDFQLVTPGGNTLTRRRYLEGIASGFLRYAVWAPDSITVHLYGTAAAIRYTSQLMMIVAGKDTIKPFRHWHTDLYERRAGNWQVVWSQATAVRQ
jgi:uncharacterized protein DUF4440